MMVTFVSQCEKNALKKTRRVLDAFANRIGDNTWQTLITEDGLQTVKKMLRKTASKSTAVSCHWIRSRSRSQLLWVVGNKRKFSLEGVVPVNRTSLNLDHKEWEQGWYLNEVIVTASSLAGLFHDFGKANALFQNKLKGKTSSLKEPFRHEWVSLRLFEAFCQGKTDEQWLQDLVKATELDVSKNIEQQIINSCSAPDYWFASQIDELAPLAKLVAWLVVSHHRLPLPHDKKVKTSEIDKWLSHCFDCHWNSGNAIDLANIGNDVLKQNWCFPQGTPFVSQPWREKASKIASRALNNPLLLHHQIPWFEQRFVSHMSRLSLMLADHYYSSLSLEHSKSAWRSPSYTVIANTDKERKKQSSSQPKQQLDEHNIGVAVNAQRFAQNLPTLKYTLPAITQHRLFSKSAPQEKYRWQDKAFAKAKMIAKESEKQGFFGVNMASTGCGKTIANARIMYALADEREGCRFSVALGLRTLTLQTGDAYRELLKLGDDELAVLVGSQAVKTLHQLNKEPIGSNSGSESAEDLFESLSISYEGQIYDGRLKHWLSHSPKLEQLISAPLLVSTIDHLMPATESKRGGHQIAPMLRLLTSDLILDEPDDFSLEDLPALCRLVNWAGMLGSRVLLSSATLPPSLIKALFDAYRAGREHFNQAHFPSIEKKSISCAWFDEYQSEIHEIASKVDYIKHHESFVDRRVNRLNRQQIPLRVGKIVNVEALQLGGTTPFGGEIPSVLAHVIAEQIHQLHKFHHVSHKSGKRVSIGVVRMANINPMISVAKELIALPPESDHAIHFCIYHSQFPLAIRSRKEQALDRILTRHDEQQLWQHPEINKAITSSKVDNLIFVVLGTSVVEVGRDHDYDWAISEPSSMRSLVQLAGRVQRHRQKPPTQPNISVLNRNIRALNKQSPAYTRPGFESVALPLSTHDMNQLINDEIKVISAIPRIRKPSFIVDDFVIDESEKTDRANPVSNLVKQEHRALRFQLEIIKSNNPTYQFYRNNAEAELWWSDDIDKKYGHHAVWNAEFIRITEFRKSQPQEPFVLRFGEDNSLVWSQLDVTCKPFTYKSQQHRFKSQSVELATGCYWWLDATTEDIYWHFAEQLSCSIEQASELLGEVSLRAESGTQVITWLWHEQLGVYL